MPYIDTYEPTGDGQLGNYSRIRVEPCPACGQTSTAAGVCAPCRDLARAPQGETVRLFTPAPAQLPGQLNL